MISANKIESMPGRAGAMIMDLKEVAITNVSFFYNIFISGEEEVSPSITLSEELAYSAASYIKIDFTPPGNNNEDADIINAVSNIDLTVEKIFSENDFNGNLFSGVTVRIPNETRELRNLIREGNQILLNNTNGGTAVGNSTTDFIKSYSNTLKENGFLFTTGKEKLSDFFASISNENLGRQKRDNAISFLDYEFNSSYFSAIMEDVSYSMSNNSTSIFSNSVRSQSDIINTITNNARTRLLDGSNPMSNYFPDIASDKVFDQEDIRDYLLDNIPARTFLKDQINQNIAHVGYIIDATFDMQSGDVIQSDPVLFINNSCSTAFITNVPYGSVASIRISPVYAMNIPIYNYDEDAEKLYKSIGTIFVSGKGKSTITEAIDNTPPPPPQDLMFNLTNSGLEINWSLPFNPQGDIAKFRVFRRKNKNEPFSLIQQIEFGGVRDPNVPGYLNSVGDFKTFFTDRSFNEESDYIYAVVCVDVHDLVSNYSEQIRVKVNSVFNRLETSLFARQGAYIPYPNMTMEKEVFTDVVKSSGYSKARIYFNPDFLRVFRKENNTELDILNLNENSDSEFKLNLINIDLQKQQSLDIIIGNRVQQSLNYDSDDSAIIRSFIDQQQEN